MNTTAGNQAQALPIGPQDALRELAMREQARRHLIDFSTYVAKPWYKPARHHLLVAEKLEQVKLYIQTKGAEGIGRLMIFEPPRHGKTEQISRLFPAWLFGDLPDARIILASYGANLAEADSRAVRNYVSSARYANVFGARATRDTDPVDLSPDSRSVSNWDLGDPHRGGVIAAGVGGGITGFGAHLLNINDPFKGREEAESEAYRDRVWTWYQSVAYPRLEDGGAIMVTQTRWDQEDLAGYLLMRMVSDDPNADKWTVVFLPGLALDPKQYPNNENEFRENLSRGIYVPLNGDMLGRAPGQALWPDKYNEQALIKIAGNIEDFEFTAQYQQMPRLAVGNLYDDDDFKFADRAPAGLQWFRYIDLALGKTQTSDFNACLAVAFDGDGNLFIRDRIKERRLEDFLPLIKAAMLSDEEQGTVWAFESNAFQSLVIQQFLRDPDLRNVAMTPMQVSDDKLTRARPWQLRAKQGKVYLVRGGWTLSFIRIAAAFGPTARYDDEIDSVSGGVQLSADWEELLAASSDNTVTYEERVNISPV